VLAAGGWPSAVAGGVALAAYGNPRLTIDLDIVTESGAQPDLVTALEAAGYRTLYRSTGFSNHLHADAEWGRVDMIYVDAATSAKLFPATRLLPGPGGRAIRVPRPEHLIAMKVQAIANAPERTLQDLADIRQLLALPELDLAEARGYFAKAGLLEKWKDVRDGP
jgi:hypothetical protein